MPHLKNRRTLLLHFTYELFLSRKDLPCLLLKDFFIHVYVLIKFAFHSLCSSSSLIVPNTFTLLSSWAVVVQALRLLNVVCMCMGVGLSTRAWVASEDYILKKMDSFPCCHQLSIAPQLRVGLWLAWPCAGLSLVVLASVSSCVLSCPTNTVFCRWLLSFCPFF